MKFNEGWKVKLSAIDISDVTPTVKPTLPSEVMDIPLYFAFCDAIAVPAWMPNLISCEKAALIRVRNVHPKRIFFIVT